RLRQAAPGNRLGAGNLEPDRRGCLQAADRAGMDETARSPSAGEGRRGQGPIGGKPPSFPGGRERAMSASQPVRGKKYFTVTEANASLPLLRAIVRDITELARDLRKRHDLLVRTLPSERGTLSEAHREELQHVQEEFDRDQERMVEYEEELKKLGVELKD